MRSLYRLFILLGLFAITFGLYSAKVAAAPTTTIEITDVYDAVNPADEWFQLYNVTKSGLTLTGWKVCTSGTCLDLPTTTVEPYSLSKIKASSVAGWPATGLNGTADLVGLLDDKGTPVDSVNWGATDKAWSNYVKFIDLLWEPGVKAPNPSANQSFFRLAIGSDSDKPGDWLTTASAPVAGAAPTNTPAPQVTTAPATQPTTAAVATTVAATPTTASSGSTTGAGGGSVASATPTPKPQATVNPKTGGEFPIMVALALIAGLFALRFARRGVVARS